MSFKSVFLFVSLNSIMIFNTACPSNPGGSQEERILVTGDPLAFIEGTAQDPNSGIAADLFTDPDDEWQIYAASFVTQRQEKVENGNIEAGNEAATQDVTEEVKKSVNTYKMSEGRDEDEMVFESTTEDYFKFFFAKRNGALFIKSFSDYRNLNVEDYSFQVHHYSVRPDNKAFSILISGQFDADPRIHGERYLTALYFVKKDSNSILSQMVSTAYNYLLGPGIKLAWDQSKELKLTICSESASMMYYTDLVEQSVAAWQPPLKKRLDLTSEVSGKACPPFSDVNSQTIRHVDRWIQIQSPEYMTAGATLVSYDLFGSKIIDSDIFLMEGEWNEALASSDLNMGSYSVYSSSLIKDSYRGTMTHEIGHLLGLDHVFDGRPSIMSYNDEGRLYSYDREAVAELYPEVVSGTQSPSDFVPEEVTGAL